MFLQVAVRQEFPPANTHTVMEQAALFCGLYKCTPRSLGYSPPEISYGRPPPVIEKLKGDHQQLADLELSQHLQALGKVFCYIAW